METRREDGAVQAEIVETLRALRDEIARLSERVARLEAAGAPAGAPGAAAAAPAPEETPSEELMLVIAAAAAAFLGKRARVRQVRVLDSRTWSHQGRVSVQASHTFSRG